MVKKADVVVENFRPGVKKRLGIDYKTLARINPRLVYASISGFGQDGPYADRPGFDQIAQGMAGLMSINGLPDMERSASASLSLTLALGCSRRSASLSPSWSGKNLARASESRPRPCRRKSSCSIFRPARYLVQGEVAQQAGNHHPTSIPTGVFKTSDGYVNIATTGGTMWERLCRTIKAGALLQKEDYRTTAARSKNRDALDAEIETYLKERHKRRVVERLNRRACPAGLSILSIKRSQIRRCGISASRKRQQEGQRYSTSHRPAGVAVAHTLASCGAGAGTQRAYRCRAQGIRLFRARDRRASQGEGSVMAI